MRRSGLLIIAIVGLFSAVGTANAQCETAGECFCDTQGMVGIAQLIRGVNIALGSMDCPAISRNACSCCACDFGGGDIECGAGDTDCLDCQVLGGAPAPDCSICGDTCSSGETLCNNNPQHCQVATHCACCACDFGGGDIECGNGDVDCAECIALGAAPAAECTICSGACTLAQTACTNDPGACKLTPTPQARTAGAGSGSRYSAATRAQKGPYNH